MYGKEKIMTWIQRIILPYVYPTKFSEATPKQTAGAGQDENNGSQCKTNRLRAHQVVSSAHCTNANKILSAPSFGIRMHPYAD
jgi:hypothetical protein